MINALGGNRLTCYRFGCFGSVFLMVGLLFLFISRLQFIFYTVNDLVYGMDRFGFQIHF